MKKFVVVAIILLLVGYVLYKNGSLWLLKILAHGEGSPVNISSNTASTGPNPPFKDGTYTGKSEDAYYGNIQVQAVILDGKITNVRFLQYPNDRARSIAINTLAMPNLKQEAIQSQNANVDIISGATDSSQAFMQSLASALTQAK